MADANAMPTRYETKTTTTSSTSIGLHPEYIRTVPGILKIIEIVLGILTVICASVLYGFVCCHGGGWIEFVAVTSILITAFFFFGRLLNFLHKLPGPWIMIALGILTTICASINWSFVHFHGGAWIQFTAVTSMLGNIIFFTLYFINLWRRIPRQKYLVILSILTFICSCVSFYNGQGWVQFVAMSAFFTTLIYFVLHLCNLISHFPGPYLLIEFLYYCVFTVFYLISAIVAAVKGGWHPSIGATAFFAFAATAVYAVDTFFQYRAYRSGQTEMTTNTTTTTTERNLEAQHQTY